MIVREEDEGLYKVSKKQKQAVVMDTPLTDDVELRENQAENMYQTAFKALLAGPSDSNHEFVICSAGPSSGHQPTMMLLNKKGNPSSNENSSTDVSTPNFAAAAGSSNPNAKAEKEDDDGGNDLMSLLGAFGGAKSGSTAVAAKAKAKAKAKASAGGNGGGGGVKRKATADTPSPVESVIDVTKAQAVMANLQPKIQVGGSGEDKSSGTGKRGRVSATTLAENDDKFLEEVKGMLFDILQTDQNKLPESSEIDLVAACKVQETKCQEVVNKCSTKIGQIKRRKVVQQDDGMTDAVKEVNGTAASFSRLFHELACTSPKATELAQLMETAAAVGYRCGNMATMKLLKAKTFDLVKYNRYPQVATIAAEVSQSMTEPEDQKFFQTHFGIILEQVLQKLLRTLPATQLKLNSPGVQYIRSFLKAMTDHDALSLVPSMTTQVTKLLAILTIDDKTILPDQVLEAVKAVRSPTTDERLFIAMKTLSQGNHLLTEAATIAESRKTSDSCLAELASLTSQVSGYDSDSANLPKKEGMVEKVCESWDKVLKIEKDLVDKPETSNVSTLKAKLTSVAKVFVKFHADEELSAFIASQVVHSNNKMKCLTLPTSWSVCHLRKYIPEETLFRCSLGIDSFMNLIDFKS